MLGIEKKMVSFSLIREKETWLGEAECPGTWRMSNVWCQVGNA